ncbi:hypothetical protein MASSI9I_50072 [Massilia sp. 9I]|nr:hypothetical protein MASSI9I_50072 [Massilia sp. 9I]
MLHSSIILTAFDGEYAAGNLITRWNRRQYQSIPACRGNKTLTQRSDRRKLPRQRKDCFNPHRLCDF